MAKHHNGTTMLKPIEPKRQIAYKPPLRSEVAADMNKRLLERITSHKETLAKFAEKMGIDPMHALSWSREEFAAAAELRVLEHLQEAVTAKGWDILPAMRREWLAQILSKAECPESSSSATNNIMDRYFLAAFAKLYRNQYGSFSEDYYLKSPVDEVEQLTQQNFKQMDFDKKYGEAMVEYEKEIRRYKHWKKTGEILPWRIYGKSGGVVPGSFDALHRAERALVALLENPERPTDEYYIAQDVPA